MAINDTTDDPPLRCDNDIPIIQLLLTGGYKGAELRISFEPMQALPNSVLSCRPGHNRRKIHGMEGQWNRRYWETSLGLA